MLITLVTGFGTLLVLLAGLTTPKLLPERLQEEKKEKLEMVQSLLTGGISESLHSSWNVSQISKPEKPKLPQYMVDLYNQYAYNKTSVPMANIIRSINPEDILQWSSKENCTCRHALLFTVSIPEHEEVTKAELQLSLGDWGNGHLRLFNVTDPEPSETFEGSSFFLASKEVTGEELVTFDVTETVQRLMRLKTQKLKLGFILEAQRSQDVCTESGMVSLTFDSDQPPILLIFSDDGSKKKARLKKKLQKIILHEQDSNFGMFLKNTSYNDIDDKTLYKKNVRKKRNIGKNTCKKVSMMVNIKDIGWDKFVIHPLTFDAGQCVGKCNYPLLESVTPTKHAIIQSLMHNRKPRDIGNVCCVPTKLEGLSILYRDHDSHVIKKEESMRVAQCGCR